MSAIKYFKVSAFNQRKELSHSPDFYLGICVTSSQGKPGMELPSLTHFHLRTCCNIGKFTIYPHRAVWLFYEKICIPENWGIKVKLVGQLKTCICEDSFTLGLLSQQFSHF